MSLSSLWCSCTLKFLLVFHTGSLFLYSYVLNRSLSDLWCSCTLKYFLVSSTVLPFTYHNVLKNWSYFGDRNIKYERGLPLLGTFWRFFFNMDGQAQGMQKLYKKFPNERFVGMYETFGTPSYLIRDPELIKQIAIRDFDHFVNHEPALDAANLPMFARTVFMLRYEPWRQMRATVSPAFISSRMRLMHVLMVETSKEFCDTLGEHVRGGQREYEAEELFSKFTNDIIASCAFGTN